MGNFLVFFAMASAVELCLFGFKIQNPRTRVFCRCLPILKLPLGLVLYSVIDLNFFSCQSIFSPKYLVDHAPQGVFLVSFLALTAVFVLRRMYQYFMLISYLRKACRGAKLATRPIFNHKLRNSLKEKEIQLLMTNAFSVPVAVGNNTILIPQTLINTFSQEEFEAVVAHELDHLHWKDPYVKFFCLAICEIFWWIPTKWWLNRLEEDQEYACDRGIDRFGLEGTALASALMKVLKQEKWIYCAFTAQKHQALLRVEKMLDPREGSGPVFLGLTILATLFVLIGYNLC